YFDNKEHLIRTIWTEDILPKADEIFAREDLLHSENGILNAFSDYAKLVFSYRFFYAEGFILLRNDPEMMKIYKPRCQKLFALLNEIFTSWEETGIIKPINKASKKFLAENIYVVAQTWINLTDLLDEDPSEEELFSNAILHSYALLVPFFTSNAKERTLILLKKKGMLGDADTENFNDENASFFLEAE
ncbi:MAG: TetR/AcrR family transcriptional regulator, partial [Anaerovoracaceae bacterium]